jgi:hypothetical protein
MGCAAVDDTVRPGEKAQLPLIRANYSLRCALGQVLRGNKLGKKYYRDMLIWVEKP